MTRPAATYDLMLLLDPAAEDSVRAKIIADINEQIAAMGNPLSHNRWGERPLAYQIDHKAGAEYHLFQFNVSTPQLLHDMDRTLKITDGVLRFRIVKLKPGTPPPPDMRPGHETPRARDEHEALGSHSAA